MRSRGLTATGVTFVECLGRGADFRDIDAEKSSFNRCTLLEVDFSGGKLRGTDFSGSDLSGAKFADADVRDCNFQGCNLDGADFTGARTCSNVEDDPPYPEARFVGASMDDLHGVEVKGLGLEETTPLALLLDQTGPLRAYLVTSPETVLEPGQIIEAKKDVRIALCSRNKIMDGMPSWLVEFDVGDMEIPMGSDGRFLVSKAKVLKKVEYAH